jgi:ABC-type uncharacterized transport system auxiliary subunit
MEGDLERGFAADAFAACVLAAACHGSAPELRDYLLASGPPAAEPSPEPSAPRGDLPAIRVKPLLARGFLDRPEIAWRQGDVLAGAYRWHRWLEPPAEMVTHAWLEALRAGGRFAAVDNGAARPSAPFTLSGELLGFHELTDADGGKPRGVVEVEVTVEREARDGSAPLHRVVRATRTVAAADDTIDALVRALSEATAQAVGDLAVAVEAAVGELSAR